MATDNQTWPENMLYVVPVEQMFVNVNDAERE